MFLIQVVRGRPGSHLQFSGGGSKTAWLGKVRRRELMMDESGGWLIVRPIPFPSLLSVSPRI